MNQYLEGMTMTGPTETRELEGTCLHGALDIEHVGVEVVDIPEASFER